MVIIIIIINVSEEANFSVESKGHNYSINYSLRIIMNYQILYFIIICGVRIL